MKQVTIATNACKLQRNLRPRTRHYSPEKNDFYLSGKGVRRERAETCTWAIGTGELETLFLDDEAGANESAGNHGQQKPREIARAHRRCFFVTLGDENEVVVLS